MGAAGGWSVWLVVLAPKLPRPRVFERPLADQEGGAPRIAVWMESAQTPPTSSEGQAKDAAHGEAAAHGAPASPCTSVSGSQWLDERIGELTGNRKYTLTLQGHETDRYPLSSSQWFLNTSLACFLRLYTEKKMW